MTALFDLPVDDIDDAAALERLLIKSANIRLMATAAIGRVSVPTGE